MKKPVQKSKGKHLTFIGKVRQMTNKSSGETFSRIIIDNVNSMKPDGTVNKYFKGNLIWVDAATKNRFKVKSIRVLDAPENDRGELLSLALDLSDAFSVELIGEDLPDEEDGEDSDEVEELSF